MYPTLWSGPLGLMPPSCFEAALRRQRCVLRVQLVGLVYKSWVGEAHDQERLLVIDEEARSEFEQPKLDFVQCSLWCGLTSCILVKERYDPELGPQ